MKEINNHLVVDLSKEWRSLFWKKKIENLPGADSWTTL